MEEKIIEYSDKIFEALQSGAGFASEQAPLLIQEILTYYTIMYLCWSIFLGIVTVFTAFLLFKYWGQADLGDSDEFFMGLLLTVFWCFPFGIFMFILSYLVKVTTAPRLFLLERITSLLN